MQRHVSLSEIDESNRHFKYVKLLASHTSDGLFFFSVSEQFICIFSMRWSSHRSNWNRPNCEFDENNKDKVALVRHFSESHGNVNKPPIHEAYTVTFVEEPNSLSLDFCEDKWYHRLDAQINIQNMILPRVR